MNFQKWYFFPWSRWILLHILYDFPVENCLLQGIRNTNPVLVILYTLASPLCSLDREDAILFFLISTKKDLCARNK